MQNAKLKKKTENYEKLKTTMKKCEISIQNYIKVHQSL